MDDLDKILDNHEAEKERRRQEQSDSIDRHQAYEKTVIELLRKQVKPVLEKTSSRLNERNYKANVQDAKNLHLVVLALEFSPLKNVSATRVFNLKFSMNNQGDGINVEIEEMRTGQNPSTIGEIRTFKLETLTTSKIEEIANNFVALALNHVRK